MTEPNVVRPHVWPVRVYWEDTDAGGVVYYANYLKFAERARSEMIRSIGIDNSRLMRENGIAFAVRHCEADFLAPARLDDLLEIHTTLDRLQGASLGMTQVIRREADDLVRLSLRLACLSLTGGPARIPGGLRASLNNIFEVNR